MTKHPADETSRAFILALGILLLGPIALLDTRIALALLVVLAIPIAHWVQQIRDHLRELAAIATHQATELDTRERRLHNRLNAVQTAVDTQTEMIGRSARTATRQ